jgi:hypothetical protein
VWVDLINSLSFLSDSCVRSRVQQPHHQPLLCVRGHRERPERQQIQHIHCQYFYDPNLFQVQILIEY